MPALKIAYLSFLWLSLLFTTSITMFAESKTEMITNTDVVKIWQKLNYPWEIIFLLHF